METKQLVKKIFIQANLTLITGLHIGDSKENVEIGGVDNPIIRRRDNYEPYIPGSSLKGKMRCLLQQIAGEMGFDHPKGNKSLIGELFGASGDTGNASRLIVRDAYLTLDTKDKDGNTIPGSATKLKDSEYTDLPYTEVKFENVIHRVKGVAEHPRQQERVPAGAEFELNFIINIFKSVDNAGKETMDEEEKLVQLFKKGIEALEDDYLGGNGSRGCGQVQIKIIEQKQKLAGDYLIAY